MADTAIDTQTDAQTEAVAQLLYEAIRAKFGAEACSRVYKWPVQIGLVPNLQFPCLAVYVPNERQERSGHFDDIRATTYRVDYYAPTTGIDRIELRWPLLRAVWTLCLTRLRVGYDPEVNDGENIREVGLEAPSPVVGAVTYQTAQTDSGVVPSFFATVTLSVSQSFDWSDYAGEDLEGIDTDADVLPLVDPPPPGDPPEDPPLEPDSPSWADTTDLD